jgi:two-component system, LuxR family, response regulator FixJ
MKLPAHLHVSVADPDPALYQRMLPSFTAAGARLRHFGTGADCLRAAVEDPPCSLVVSGDLADMSGIELLRELRAQRVHAPAVLIVMQGDVLSAVNAMRDGAVDVIEKPVVISRLLHVLVRHTQPGVPRAGIVGCGA